MAVREFQINFPGQQVNPRIGHMLTSDTLAVATAAGYLNPYLKAYSVEVRPTDAILLRASDGINWYKPVFGASGVVTLTAFP